MGLCGRMDVVREADEIVRFVRTVCLAYIGDSVLNVQYRRQTKAAQKQRF